jgi:PKD repeat protein
MYYVFTHMNALVYDLDVKAGGAGDNNFIFSPKFTYNMVNGGSDDGSWMSSGWAIGKKHGCAVWAQWPYDTNFRAWPLTAEIYRNALNWRVDTQGTVSSCGTETGLGNLKTLLANGYVLSFATDIYGWQYKAIGNDPNMEADDAFVGKNACYYCVTSSSGHGMTVVGYNDDIWIDINGNGTVDAGEKGALRICNSWGNTWQDGGFVWLAYDALKTTSAVANGPSANRVAAWWYDAAYWITAKKGYAPKATAEFKLNHLKRDQLRVRLGIGETSSSTPTVTWLPATLLYNAGGAYAFNGTTTACDGVFVFDFTDILPPLDQTKRWFVGVHDNAAGDAATLKTFKIVNHADESVVCDDLPKTADAAEVFAWVEYARSNTPPTISTVADQTVDEGAATATIPFVIGDGETAADDLTLSKSSDNASLAPTSNVILGGTGANRTVKITPAAYQHGTATVTLTVADEGGLTASVSFILTVNPVNDPPAIVGGPTVAPKLLYVNQSASFSVTATDPDGDELAYLWNFGDGRMSAAAAPTYAYAAAGTYAATVTISDGQGGVTTGNLSVEILANSPPLISSGPTASSTAVSVKQGVAFSVTATDADGDELAYLWDFGDGQTSAAVGPTYAYAAVGTYAATVTISDGKGGVATGSLAITVLPAGDSSLAIQFTALPVVTPNLVKVGRPALFSGSAVAADGKTPTYVWDFGDGQTADKGTVTHQYATPGLYIAQLTAADGLGNTATAVIVVTAVESDAASELGQDDAADSRELGLTRVRVMLKFKENGKGRDVIMAMGTLALPAETTVAGERVEVEIGGVLKTFVLDARGRALADEEYDKNNRFQLGLKIGKDGSSVAQTAKFKTTFAKGDFAEALEAIGLGNFTTEGSGEEATIDASIAFGGTIHVGLLDGLYKAKENDGGRLNAVLVKSKK